jgi:hypothetical protein
MLAEAIKLGVKEYEDEVGRLVRHSSSVLPFLVESLNMNER